MNSTWSFFDVTITIFVGDQPVQKTQMTAPRFVIEQEFLALARQIANQPKPMKVVMERYEIGWDRFEQKEIILPCKMEFTNYEAMGG